MRNACALLLALFFLSGSAYAFSVEQNSDGTTRTILDYIQKYVDVPKGATDWKVFATTKEVDVKTKDKDGYDLEYSKPEFSPEVKALEGKQVTVKGYMFPLEENENQKLFLFGPFPLSCPFHYHVGPSLVLEVHAGRNAIKFDYEPIVITGTLELVPSDPDYNNTFYRLHDAELMPQP